MSKILAAIFTGLLAGKLCHLWAPQQHLMAWLIVIVTAVGWYLLMRTETKSS